MNKSRLVSVTLHVLLIALLFAGIKVTHPVVERQRFAEQLVFPVAAMALPVPHAIPSPSRAPRASAAAPLTVARLAIAAPSTLRPTRAVEVPRMAALSQPGTLELPSSTVRVSEAPQVTVGTFGSTAGAASGHQGGSVSTAGFGATAGSRGTQRNGEARVVTAGFNLPPAAPAPRAVTTSIARPPIQPVILSEPAPVYSEAARAARIQGTVDIRVKLRVDGSLEVLDIVNGLPGLNDSALAVARGIRFIPGSSDFTTLIHVRFELADQ